METSLLLLIVMQAGIQLNNNGAVLLGSKFTLGERTINRLECINSKVKSICSCYADLSMFFDQFFLLCLVSAMKDIQFHCWPL